MSSARQQDAALLGALFRSRNQHVTRQALASHTGISARELDQRLIPYLQAGYPIEVYPQGTLCLHEPPDIWCAEEILGRCPRSSSSAPAWNPLLLTETTSTNDVARDQGRRGQPAGFVVAASRQTAGRGRLGRAWESPPNSGLYVSLLLRPDLHAAEASRLPILASVAAADAVEAVTGTRPEIKWPNDLLLRGRKLGGLLIETEMSGPRLAFAVVGIGLNVRHAEGDFSPAVRGLATSLHLATGQLYRRADVLVALLQALERRLARPFAEVREAWTTSSLTLGQRVELNTARGRKVGQAMGLDDSGALLLRADSGEIETITAGDMQALR
ncbi:MAG TPA: biotin--[acetyl-CoA-carboxylase] ligase [Candidatus Methylacidiphilales bacterium]|jgi:BirA family biotin operon repressor/biotin-[acetyl-CoA-carboxylase] ligase|nr:biotin--[acetyl-CoA-carboxylase] ligase [Candidatus Methylacidiphilales bacterium]